MIDKKASRLALALVLIHLAVSFVHGAAHSLTNVMLSLFGSVYVLVVITIGPVIAVILLYTKLHSIGAWTFLLTMTGSFCFGVLYHFILHGPDNVVNFQGHSLFTWSAIGIAILEFVGMVFGLWLIRASRNRTSN